MNEALKEFLAAEKEAERKKRDFEACVNVVWEIVGPQFQTVNSYIPSVNTPINFQEFNSGKDVSSLQPHLKFLLYNYIKCNFEGDVPAVDECAKIFVDLCRDPAHGNNISWESIAEVQVAVNMIQHKIVAPPISRHTAEVDFTAFAWQGDSFFPDSYTAIKHQRDNALTKDADKALLIDVKCFPEVTSVDKIKGMLIKQAATVDIVAVCTDGSTQANLEAALVQLDTPEPPEHFETRRKVVIVVDGTWALRMLTHDGIVEL